MAHLNGYKITLLFVWNTLKIKNEKKKKYMQCTQTLSVQLSEFYEVNYLWNHHPVTASRKLPSHTFTFISYGKREPLFYIYFRKLVLHLLKIHINAISLSFNTISINLTILSVKVIHAFSSLHSVLHEWKNLLVLLGSLFLFWFWTIKNKAIILKAQKV